MSPPIRPQCEYYNKCENRWLRSIYGKTGKGVMEKIKELYHVEIHNLNPFTNFCYSVIKPTRRQSIVNNSWKENGGANLLFRTLLRV
jgi:hypothetical protein